jgi:hypothetical protein
MFDDQTKTLFAWCAQGQLSAELLVVDYKSGVQKSLYNSTTLSANGGSSTIDAASNRLFASLLNWRQQNQPFFLSIDLDSGSVSPIVANPDANYPYMLNLGVVH